MTKAEQRGLEAYPVDIQTVEEISWGSKSWADVDINEIHRKIFIKGYEQAEKDYALTWKDIRQICTIADDFFDEDDLELSDEEFFSKILKQFKLIDKKYESKEV